MTQSPQPLWELRQVSKHFAGVLALKSVSVSGYEGEILGLIGANGSGKSTLVKCLTGVHRPDEGSVVYAGQKVHFADPFQAKAMGIACVFQEFSLVQELTVAENIFLGKWARFKGTKLLDWRAMRAQSAQLLESLNIKLRHDALVKDLSVAEQQLVEIAKAISQNARLIIMDEPSTALSTPEIGRLHGLLVNMAKEMRSVIYISHRLDEVQSIANRVTILRNGQVVDTKDAHGLTVSRMVELMLGDGFQDKYQKKPAQTREALLQVTNISTKNGVSDVSLSINRGEVFGLAGLMGSGRTEIARAIFGVDSLTSGFITMNGIPVNLLSPQHAISSGIAFISENRKTDGLFQNFAVTENITVANLRAIRRRMFLDLHREKAASASYLKLFSIATSSQWGGVLQLSGGNQQKVIISRWLFTHAKLVIMDEPTQGIDIAAKLEIYNLINQLTDEGKSVLLITSDHEELLKLSDRVGIVRSGRLTRILDARLLNQHELVENIMGDLPTIDS